MKRVGDVRSIDGIYYCNNDRLAAIVIQQVESGIHANLPTYTQVRNSSNIVWIPSNIDIPKLIAGINDKHSQAIKVLKQALCL
jgi:hypothetical protein